MDLALTDEEIALRALDDPSNNWNLGKMLKDLGPQYHYNELPTVVYENDKYIVYNGNRRVALLKCLQSPHAF